MRLPPNILSGYLRTKMGDTLLWLAETPTLDAETVRVARLAGVLAVAGYRVSYGSNWPAVYRAGTKKFCGYPVRGVAYALDRETARRVRFHLRRAQDASAADRLALPV